MTSSSFHPRSSLPTIWTWAFAACMFVTLSVPTMPVYAESAVEKLEQVINENLLVRPAALGVVRVVIMKDDSMWTEVNLPFDDLRSEPRQLAAQLGWKSGEVVPIRISRDFTRIVICRRDLVDGC